MTDPVADASTDDLLLMLASEDPTVRDDTAMPELAGRVESGALDNDLVGLGDRLVGTFVDGPVQARTFAALVLGEVVERDRVAGIVGAGAVVGAQAVARWRQEFLAWWLGETDLRGWDPELGWLHAVAHGADALLAFGRSPHSDPDALVGLLEAAARRVASTEALFDAAEETGWLTRSSPFSPDRTSRQRRRPGGWRPSSPGCPRSGPVPPFAVNTVHTVTALSLMVDRGCRLPGAPAVVTVPHRSDVLDALADVYRVAWSLLG